mgnify:CR=1 FL=1
MNDFNEPIVYEHEGIDLNEYLHKNTKFDVREYLDVDGFMNDLTLIMEVLKTVTCVKTLRNDSKIDSGEVANDSDVIDMIVESIRKAMEGIYGKNSKVCKQEMNAIMGTFVHYGLELYVQGLISEVFRESMFETAAITLDFYVNDMLKMNM